MSDMDDLFALARGAASPPEGAKERVLLRVLASVPPGPGGSGGGGGGTLAAPAPAVTGGVASLAAALVFALAGILGGALYIARTKHEPSPVVEIAPTPALVAPPTLPAPSPPAVLPTPSAIVDLDAPRVVRPAASNPTDSLAAELALIRSAQSALGSGNAALALQTLERHAQKFPRGKLAQEREVMRVRALCRAGRLSEARAAYRVLAKGAPSSPHLASVRASCPGLADD